MTAHSMAWVPGGQSRRQPGNLMTAWTVTEQLPNEHMQTKPACQLCKDKCEKLVALQARNHTSKSSQQALLDDVRSINELTNCNQRINLAQKRRLLVAWSENCSEGLGSSAMYTEGLLQQHKSNAIGRKHTSWEIFGTDQLRTAKGDRQDETRHQATCNAYLTQDTTSQEESSTLSESVKPPAICNYCMSYLSDAYLLRDYFLSLRIQWPSISMRN